jgi:hypothetical protein
MRGERGDEWKTNRAQRKAGTDKTFALDFGEKDKKMKKFKDLHGKTFKDLTEKEQKFLRSKYRLRCAVIPSSWPMDDYIDFFNLIQGGGTRMTPHELRRAMTQGAFTEKLDDLSDESKDSKASKLLHEALRASNFGRDKKQELLLRFFQLQREALDQFGKPSMRDQSTELMKFLNHEAGKNEGSQNLDGWVRNLEAALEVALYVFPEDDERFRRASPVSKRDEGQITEWARTTRMCGTA